MGKRSPFDHTRFWAGLREPVAGPAAQSKVLASLGLCNPRRHGASDLLRQLRRANRRFGRSTVGDSGRPWQRVGLFDLWSFDAVARRVNPADVGHGSAS